MLVGLIQMRMTSKPASIRRFHYKFQAVFPAVRAYLGVLFRMSRPERKSPIEAWYDGGEERRANESDSCEVLPRKICKYQLEDVEVQAVC